jgi:hypothetical protein
MAERAFQTCEGQARPVTSVWLGVSYLCAPRGVTCDRRGVAEVIDESPM